MKSRVLILAALIALLFAQAADAQRGSRQANPTPEPTPTVDARTFHQIQIRISASESWTYIQSDTTCRLDVPASQQKLIAVPAEGAQSEFSIPGGTPTNDLGCEIELEIELVESTSYSFYVGEVFVAESTSDQVLSGEPINIELAEIPEPTPLPTEAATHEPSLDPEAQVQINIFVLESFTQVNGTSCKPDIAATAIIRVQDSKGNVWTIRFSRAELVAEDNEHLPGERGCLATGTIAYDQSERYSVTLNDQLLLELDGSLLASGDPFIIAIDENGVVMDDQEGIHIPTPTPTPRPTQTPQPTPTPRATGDLGDGTYLLRGYLTLRSENVVSTDDLCFGTGGYSDIGSGTQVVIRDGDNNVMGIGDLAFSEEMTFGSGCTFVFEIEVEETRFYQIEMSHRGGMVFTFTDLEEERWTIFLTLGR